jgi:hypothetical protein
MYYHRSPNSTYLMSCTVCHGTTSKSFARAHDGKCKACFTGVAPTPKYACGQCGAPISKYKHDHHYVCESCFRQNDPMGYALECRTPQEPPEPMDSY